MTIYERIMTEVKKIQGHLMHQINGRYKINFNRGTSNMVASDASIIAELRNEAVFEEHDKVLDELVISQLGE